MLSFRQKRDLKKNASTFISLVVFLASSMCGYASESEESEKKEEGAKLKTEVALGKMNEASIAVGKDSDASAKWSVALGLNAKASDMVKKYGTVSDYEKRNADGMVAIGYDAVVETHTSVAIGKDAKAWARSENTNGQLNRNNLAIGYMSQSGEAYSTGLGSRTRANGRFSTAIGSDAWIQETGSRAVAIGNRATVGEEYKYTAQAGDKDLYVAPNDFVRGLDEMKSEGQFGAIAIGRYSHVTKANAIALGHMAEVKKNNSVAIGVLSEANEVDDAVVLGSFSNVERNKYSLGYDPETSKDREITGNESDKINEYNKILDKLKRYNELNFKGNKMTSEEQDEFAKLCEEQIKCEIFDGKEIREVSDSIVYFDNAKELSARIEQLEKEKDKNNKTWRSTLGAVSVGNAKKGITRQITNVAAGSKDTDAVNVAQLKSSVKMINEVRNGEAGIAVYTDKAGKRVKKATNGNYYTEDAFRPDGVLTEDSSKKVVDSDNLVISLAGKDMSTNNNIILRNIAAGEADNDAVNVRQLNNAMATNISFFNGGIYYTTDNNYKPGTQNFNIPLNKLSFDFGEGIKATKVGEVGKERVLITLDKEYIKNDKDLKGPAGPKGEPGKAGKDGLTPEIKNGNWWIGGKDTEVKAEGPQGLKGDKGEAGIVSIKTDKGSMNISSGNSTSSEGDSSKENSNTDNSSSLVIKGDNKNITTSIKNGEVIVKLNNNIQGDKLTISNKGPEISNDGINANKTTITNINEGKIEKESKDAVNGGQLYVVAEEVKTKVNKDLDNLSDIGISKVKKLAKSSIEVNSEGKIKVTKVNDGDKDVYTVTSTSQEQLGYKTEDGKELVLKDNELFVKDGEIERKATEKEKANQKAHLKDAEGKADKEVRLSNIADGEISETSTDAVNGRQINAVRREVKSSLDQTNRRVDKLEESIARQNEKIENLRKDLNTGMAQLSAMSAVDFGHTKKKKVKVGAGLGGYRGERAVAVGVAISPTDNLLINAKMSMSAKDAKNATFGVGATYEFNYD